MNHPSKNNLPSKLNKKINPSKATSGDRDADWLVVCEISLTQRGKDKSWLQRQQILPPLALLPVCMGKIF